MDVKKIWLITGVSRGLGKELAKAVAARGHIVVGTSRDGFCDLNTPLDHLEVLPMELSSAPQIQSVVDHVLARFGRIDVLVNNAGYGLMSAIEEASEEELARVYEVNLFGPLRLVRAVLPALRAQKSGHIINVSSIAATAPGAGSGLYASAKSAVEGFSESLALEMAPLGVSVSSLCPEYSARISSRTIASARAKRLLATMHRVPARRANS